MSEALAPSLAAAAPAAADLMTNRARRRAAIAACRAVTERHARTFSFAARLLPAGLRAACYAVYAFCRRADDAVDAAPDAYAARRALEGARARLRAAWAREATCDPDLEVAALAWAARRFAIPRQPLEQLLEGMALDLEPLRVQSWPQLHLYCVLAAGVVGRALAPALGAPAQAAEAAEALGVAMQLTNILRDVDEDLARGRVYLPERELKEAGLSHAALEQARAARRASPELRRFLAAQIERARAWYARAEEGVRAIPGLRARLCVRAMGVIYGDILRSLERQGLDPFAGRAHVPLARKLWLLVTCLFARRLPAPRPS